MFAKFITTTALIGICLPFVFCQVATECKDSSDYKIFECDGSDPRSVTIYGAAMKCPSGSTCNAGYKASPKATGNDKICKPCLKLDEVCKDAFKCADSTHVTMTEVEFECPRGTMCNANPTDSCKPCVDEICDKTKWTCDDHDESLVIIGKFKGKCDAPSKCNKNYEAPCDPCTDPKGTTSITPSRGTTTATTRPNQSTTTTSPTTTSATTGSTSTINPSGSTGSSSATTTEKPNTTTHPPFKIPDCNDGLADIKPCRPGPNGMSYYYKCKYYSPVWYDYEIKLCKDLGLDPRCLGKVCLN